MNKTGTDQMRSGQRTYDVSGLHLRAVDLHGGCNNVSPRRLQRCIEKISDIRLHSCASRDQETQLGRSWIGDTYASCRVRLSGRP